MEQDRGRRGVDEMREIQQQQQQQQQLQQQQKDHHQRSSGVIKQENNQHHPPPQQPQKCPRCDSLNTKFCYYNNYSLSQPRFFCKTCRRYWTQGGTLRNVPVGGGCRKGKRLKRSSSSPENHLNISSHSNSSTLSSIPSVAPPLRNKGIDGILQSSTPNLLPIAATGVPPQPSMYYPGGGFLSSLAAFPSFNHQPSINVGGGEFGSSNLALLQGFSLPFHTQQQMHHHQQQLHQQQQHQHQQQLYLHQPHNFNLGLSSSDDGLEEKVVVQPNKPSTSHQEWSQSFNPSTNSINTSAAAATGYWSSNNTTNTNNTSTINTSTTTSTSVSLNPTHWTDHLSGYGPPPPPPTSTTSSSSPSFL